MLSKTHIPWKYTSILVHFFTRMLVAAISRSDATEVVAEATDEEPCFNCYDHCLGAAEGMGFTKNLGFLTGKSSGSW